MAGITPQQWIEDRDYKRKLEEEVKAAAERDRERASGKREPFYGSTVAGRPLSEFHPGEVRWFLHPYFPRDSFNLVVGETSVGKSSFLAWLIAQSKSCLLFPGYEESFEVQAVPRLIKAGVQADKVRVVQDRDWRLPECKSRLIRSVRSMEADLVVFDPISSYIGDGGNENDGQFVRGMLEAAAQVAAETGACVVGTRHPGKGTDNIMVGSREWKAVPRCVVQLIKDPGPPMRRIVRIYKDFLGQGHAAREFTLDQEPGKPPTFKLGKNLTAADACIFDHYQDDVDRARFDHAQELLKEALKGSEQPSKSLYALAEGERISERTLFRAAQGLGVVMRREGNGLSHVSLWSLPVETPPQGDSRHVGDTPPLSNFTEGGCHPHGGSGALGQFHQTARQDDEPETATQGVGIPLEQTQAPAPTKAKAKRGRPKKGAQK